MTSPRPFDLAAALAVALVPLLAMAAPDADFGTSVSSGVAPLAVHFDATNSNCDGDGSRGEWSDDLIACDFKWSFGDAGAGNWNRGAFSRSGEPKAKNAESGFVAAHVFESPGTYTVTLTVRDSNGAVDTQTKNISVSSWSGPKFCVHNGGSSPVPGSGGCPQGATVLNNGDFDAVLEDHANIDSVPAQVLFRRGDSFVANESVSQANGPGIIGAFGSGNPPVVNHGNHTLFNGARDWRVMDLKIIGNRGPNSRVSMNGTQSLYLRIDTEDHGGGTFSMGSSTFASGDTNFFLIDSDIGPIRDASGDSGETNNGMYALLTDSALMGNTWHDIQQESSRGDDGHCTRLQGFRGTILSHEDRLDCPLTAWTLRAPNTAKDTSWSELNIVGDQFVQGTTSGNVTALGQTSPSFDSNHRRTLIQDSLIRATTGQERTALMIQAKEIVIRNVVCDMAGTSLNTRCVEVEKNGGVQPSYSLTGVVLQSVTCFECNTIFRDSNAVGAKLIASVVYSPTRSGDLASGDVSVINSRRETSNPFVGPVPSANITRFRLARGVAGGPLAAISDASSALRDSTPDAGAFEFGGQTPPVSDALPAPFLHP